LEPTLPALSVAVTTNVLAPGLAVSIACPLATGPLHPATPESASLQE
jgi:hypothetical protein